MWLHKLIHCDTYSDLHRQSFRGNPCHRLICKLIIMIKIIMTALKGTIQDFYNLLTGLPSVSNNAQMAWAQACANHMQHIGRLLHATHRTLITCNTSDAYHMQHIRRLSHATHRMLITCNTSDAYHMQHIGR